MIKRFGHKIYLETSGDSYSHGQCYLSTIDFKAVALCNPKQFWDSSYTKNIIMVQAWSLLPFPSNPLACNQGAQKTMQKAAHGLSCKWTAQLDHVMLHVWMGPCNLQARLKASRFYQQAGILSLVTLVARAGHMWPRWQQLSSRMSQYAVQNA